MRLVLLGIIFTLLYGILVTLVDFEGPIALSINFLRVGLSASVLILFIPFIRWIFKTVPPPQRDYLLAGIVCQWVSVFGFSLSNEAGKIFSGWDSSVFSNPIPGFLSVLVVAAGIAHVFAPDYKSHVARRRIVALTIGATISVLVVFVAPLFRS